MFSTGTTSAVIQYSPYCGLHLSLQTSICALQYSRIQSSTFAKGIHIAKIIRRVSYALDNCGNLVDSLGVGNGQFLHVGWIHSPAARSSAHRCANPRNTRSKAGRLAQWQLHNMSKNTGGVFSIPGKIYRRFLFERWQNPDNKHRPAQPVPRGERLPINLRWNIQEPEQSCFRLHTSLVRLRSEARACA